MANTTPIFVGTPRNSFVSTGTNADTALDGTGSVATVWTAGASGSKITKIRLVHLGTNVATVLRLFVNNGGSNATPANNALVLEQTMAANTLSQVAQSIFIELPVDLVLGASNKLNVTIGTSIAAGIMVSAEGGDF